MEKPENRTGYSSHFVQNQSTKFNLIKQINVNHSSQINDLKEKSFDPIPTWETIQNQYEFTSGHQNNFGIPIEEDERMLNYFKAKNKQKKVTVQSTTTESQYKVSPTLPIISNKLKENNHQNYTEDGKYETFY